MYLANSIIGAPSWLTVDCYSAVLLLFIIITSIKTKDHPAEDGKVFMYLAIACFINVIMDILSTIPWDGTKTSEWLLRIANFFNYSLTTLLFVIYCIFVYTQISKDDKKAGKIIVLALCFIFAVDAIICFTSIFNSMYFDFYDGGYHRGNYFFIHVIFLACMALIIEFLSIYYRNFINKKLLVYLLLFPIMPFIGMIFQIIVYGVPMGLAFTTIAILLVFYFRKSRSMEYDYLTNTYNRRKLDSELYSKIKDAKENQTFGAILIDLDNFKSINDTLGHTVGDVALIDAAAILKSTVKNKEDFIARYGGDEFCLVTDTSDIQTLINIADEIDKKADKYNSEKTHPYKLGFSMGYAIYDPKSNLTLHEFFNLIDQNMYQDKKTKSLK